MNNQKSEWVNNKYTFQNFLTNETNNEAVETIIKILNCKTEYQLLYIYGQSGIGKTHLLQAAVKYLEDCEDQRKFYYVKSESFLDEFLQSVMNRTLLDFKKKYLELDFLLLDDFQMLSNKQALQEQLEYILDILDFHGKKVIIASEKSIDELNGISERLKNRIRKGAIVHMEFEEMKKAKCILFCGEPGSGKTMAMYKFLATYLKDVRNSVNIISMDNYSIKGRFECERLCKLVGIHFKLFDEKYIDLRKETDIQAITEIKRILSESEDNSINLVDFSGIKQQHDWIEIFKQGCNDVEVFYCIPAFSSCDLIERELKMLMEIPNCSVILTFSDNSFVTYEQQNKILHLDETKIIRYKTFEKINKMYQIC